MGGFSNSILISPKDIDVSLYQALLLIILNYSFLKNHQLIHIYHFFKLVFWINKGFYKLFIFLPTLSPYITKIF